MLAANETFRAGPVGHWSTLELIPFGESISFYSNGSGVHNHYSGLSCEAHRFEWQPTGDFRIRVRWLDSPYPTENGALGEGEEPDANDTPGEWELVSFAVSEENTPYGNAGVRLHVMFGSVLALDALWYQRPLSDHPVQPLPPPIGATRGGSGAPIAWWFAARTHDPAQAVNEPLPDDGGWLFAAQFVGLSVGVACALAWLFAR